MNKRNEERYSVSEYVDDMVSKEEAFAEFIVDCNICVTLVDVSMSGFGYEIERIDNEQLAQLRDEEDFMAKIYLGEDVLLTRVKNTWIAVIDKENYNKLKGGVQFSVISSEDRVKLSKHIEKFRERL